MRGFGKSPASAASASPACGPLIRTTAMAAGGDPLESAKIVSAMMLQQARVAEPSRTYLSFLGLPEGELPPLIAMATPLSMNCWNIFRPNSPIGAICLVSS